MKKENNSRQFPGESSRNRPDFAEKRRAEANDRLDATKNLSPQQRLEKLDIKFGVGQGAKKERARMHALIAGGKTKPQQNTDIATLEKQHIPEDMMQEIASMNEEIGSGKKRLKAKERRAKAKKE